VQVRRVMITSDSCQNIDLSQKTTSPLSSFLPEIIYEIAGYLSLSSDDEKVSDQSELSSFCSVNKHIRATAGPLRFREVHISSEGALVLWSQCQSTVVSFIRLVPLRHIGV
jgi:hypothetical protein